MILFPILDELLSSDTVILLLIGLVFALVIGVALKTVKQNRIGVGINLAVYLGCEALSNLRTNYLIELVALLVGTIALGGLIGFLIGLLIARIRKKNLHR